MKKQKNFSDVLSVLMGGINTQKLKTGVKVTSLIVFGSHILEHPFPKGV